MLTEIWLSVRQHLLPGTGRAVTGCQLEIVLHEDALCRLHRHSGIQLDTGCSAFMTEESGSCYKKSHQANSYGFKRTIPDKPALISDT